MTIEELDDYIQSVLRFRHVYVVEEAMKKSLPHMQFGIHSRFCQLLVRIKRRTQFKAPRPCYDESRRELRQDLRRTDGRNQGIFRIGSFKVAKRWSPSGRHRWRDPCFAHGPCRIKRIAPENASCSSTEYPGRTWNRKMMKLKPCERQCGLHASGGTPIHAYILWLIRLQEFPIHAGNVLARRRKFVIRTLAIVNT